MAFSPSFGARQESQDHRRGRAASNGVGGCRRLLGQAHSRWADRVRLHMVVVGLRRLWVKDGQGHCSDAQVNERGLQQRAGDQQRQDIRLRILPFCHRRA